MMRLRNWLLTGTSLGMLALSPLPALAQDDPLATAYQAYVAAQQSGDANALATAQQALTEQCIVAGYASLDECVAALAANAPAAEAPPAEQPAPAPEQPAPAPEAAPAEQPAPAAEAAPAPAEQPAPAAEAAPAPAPEQPAPAAEAAPAPAPEQPAPAAEAAPAPEQPAPDPMTVAQPQVAAAVDLYNGGVAKLAAGDASGQADIDSATATLQAVCGPLGLGDVNACAAQFGLALNPIPAPAPEQPAPAPEQPAPAAEQPAPAPEQPAAEQPAPEQPAAPAAEQPAPAPEQPAAPAAEQPAPAAEQPAAPAAEQPAAPAAGEQPAPADAMAAAQAQMSTAVDLYNGGVAKLAAGDASGQADIDSANATLQSLCGTLGFTDIAACAAEYGLTLNPLPAAGQAAPAEQPAAQPEQPAQPAAEQAPAEPVTGGDQPVTETAVEQLPAEVQPQEAAPLLDSAKQEPAPAAAGEAPAQPAPAAPAEPAAPPPQTDAEAQAAIQAPAADQQSVSAEQGQRVDASAVTFQPPPNVTIINNTTNVNSTTVNTTVNNTTVNNTTNNTQNNTQNNTVNNAPQGGNQPGQPGRPGRPGGDQGGGNAVSLPQFIIQIGTQLVIPSPEQDRRRIYDPGQDTIYYEELSRGRVRETIERPDGSKVVTVRASDGSIIRRSRITPDGREYVLASGNDDPVFGQPDWRDPGTDLPPLRLNIPARDYVLDVRNADEEQVAQFFSQPPVEQVRRIYTIEEVKHSARIRDSVRRLEVGNLTFDSGKATISRDQVGSLSDVANAMLQLLDRNPGETFLIEGHTDAVGSYESNLVLSDARAATVARILTDFYHVPAENLVTQGYGEQFLKVRTDAAERLNRRVTIRRITPLITIASR